MLNMLDVKTALYSLSKAKGYVITIVLSLGITLGALVAMFNVNYQLLATPLPYPDQHQLYVLQGDIYKNGQLVFSDLTSYATLVDIYKRKYPFFDQKALVMSAQEIIRNHPARAQVNVRYITPEFLALVAAPIHMGRSFYHDEGLGSFKPVAIISYKAWETLFNKSQDVISKSVKIGDSEFKIIGVTQEAFIEPKIEGVKQETDIWLPWDYSSFDAETHRSWTRLKSGQHLVAKLSANANPNLIEQSLTSTLNARFINERSRDSFFQDLTIGFNLISYQQAILGDASKSILLMFLGALTLLLIAAVNIINLIMARVSHQQHAMAIQIALGAQQKHVFSRLFAEILWLIILAAGLALTVASAVIAALKEYASTHLPRVAELQLSIESIVFTLISGCVLALAFALLVGRQINVRSLNDFLQSSSKSGGIQISSKLRGLLVLCQVTLTGILLVVSFHILLQAWQHIFQPLGFATEDIYSININTGVDAEKSIAERDHQLIAIRDTLSTDPRINSISLASEDPLNPVGLIDYLSLTPDYQNREQVMLSYIDAQYVNVLQLKLQVGRNFTSEEFLANDQVILINETLASKLYPNKEWPVSSYVYWQNGQGNLRYQIIGVVKDLSLPNMQEPARLFVPKISARQARFIVKTKHHQPLAPHTIANLVAKINSQYQLGGIKSLVNSHQLFIAQDVVVACLTGVLVLLALSLAAIGIYGVLDYSLQLRKFELGIRMAIGARPATIFLQVLKDYVALVLMGLVGALVVTAAIAHWLQQTTYSFHPSVMGWLMPIVLIVALTMTTIFFALWKIICQPASVALKGN